MGRELRRVPADWEHPKNDSGHLIPLHDGYNKQLREWHNGWRKWQEGMRSDFNGGWQPLSDRETGMTYVQWAGKKPNQNDYMPDWPESERTHFQMYEICTKGTPISPVMDSHENLARWLADTGASACGNMTATYEQWLATIKAGWAPSMAIVGGEIKIGVEMS